MLSNERLAELLLVVHEKHPNFDPTKMPLNVSGITNIQTPEKFQFCYAMRSQAVGCCGLLEMTSVYPLAQLTPVQRAILALWLHNARQPNALTGIIASTASGGHNHTQTEQEKVLMEIGFTPIFRGHNGAHGGTNNNYVTVWFFELSEGTQIPGLTPPEEPVKIARSCTGKLAVPVKKVLKKKRLLNVKAKGLS